MGQLKKYVQSKLDLDFVPFSGPLLVITHYHIAVATGFRQHVRKKRDTTPHAIRPDADNLEKFTSDALKGVTWKDDCQISWSLRTKSWTCAKEGYIDLFVRELPPGPPNYECILADIADNLRID